MPAKKIKSKKSTIKTADLITQSDQEKLDHDQHYDLDGVTQKNESVIIPSNFKIESQIFKKPDKNIPLSSEK